MPSQSICHSRSLPEFYYGFHVSFGEYDIEWSESPLFFPSHPGVVDSPQDLTTEVEILGNYS